MSDDPYNLERFLNAQRGVYQTALAEVAGGRKRSHWMWFIFPQIDGLGRSWTARKYAIKDLNEAKAYLNHEVLGKRLTEVSEAANSVFGKTAYEILGSPDDLKLRSSATLFAQVSEGSSVFHKLIDKYYAGEMDPMTLEMLGSA